MPLPGNKFVPIDPSRSIAEFLNATAAKQPAPGGGAVTALAGALAAAAGEMVLNYSVGRKSNSPHDDDRLRESLAELTRARQMLLQLMVEDQSAFASLGAAKKTGSPAEIAAVLLVCIRIPQAIAATGLAMLDLCDVVAPIANKFLLSDLAVCAELSMATVRCAIYNIRINLADIKDEHDRRAFEESTAKLLERATDRVRKVIPAIWTPLES